LKRLAVVAVSVILTANAAFTQTLIDTRNVQMSFEDQMLRGAVLREGGLTHTRFLGENYRFRGEHLTADGNYLKAYSARFYGIERYKVSTADLLLTGVGAGAQLGFFAGAIGNMLGLWDEDTSWLLMGAMSALGAAYMGTKLDDPSWRFQFRWEDSPLTVPTE
jgi:hypothetical protein